LISGAIVGAPGTLAIDVWLILLVISVALQLVPLPPAAIASLSPHAGDLHSMLSIDRADGWRPLSIDAQLTREGLETLIAAILVFWSVRATCSRGGTRVLLRALTVGGFLIAMAAVAQRATAPHLIWWTWPVKSTPALSGPFLNRNHFAAWLLMATAAAGGYAFAHLHSHHRSITSPRRFVRDLLVEGTTLLLGACLITMTVTLFATTSRGAILGFGVALGAGLVLSRRGSGSAGRARFSWGLGAAALVVAVAVWRNAGPLAQRLIEGSPVSRVTIWRETLPIIRDFTWTGTGIGTYAQAMLRYQQTEPGILFNQAHSEYVQLAAEGGVLVFVPAMGVLVTWLLLAGRRLGQERQGLSWIRVGAAAGIAGVALQSVWESPIRMMANAMLLATLAAVVVHDRGSRDDVR
jgi:O-antigen ligase